ncbi:MAG: hypothetical protein ABF289_17545, partial [Clostridiales bacterium]
KDIFNDINGIKTPSENIFLYRSMNYILNNNTDKYFAKIFWQYIRIKNESFQIKVQSNRYKGLDYFQTFYSRSTDVGEISGRIKWKMLMENQFRNKHLKKIEFRVSFPKGKSSNEIERALRIRLKDFFNSYKLLLEEIEVKADSLITVPLVGLIYHMIKRKDDGFNNKCWQNFCSYDYHWLHYGKLQQEYFAQIRALKSLIDKIPLLSRYIVGIDAASLENNTEPWVFAPVYRGIRNGKLRMKETEFDKKIIKKKKDYYDIRDLKCTFHVGEDFRHILSGLRRIDEVLDCFSYKAGDRLGHGIALGIDVDRWCVKNEVLILPRIEHLENLVWIWGLNINSEVNLIDTAYIEKLIMDNAKTIYRKVEGISAYTLWSSYNLKFDIFKKGYYKEMNSSDKRDYNSINKLFCRYVDGGDTKLWDEEKLLHSQHCATYLERMQEPIQIKLNNKDKEIIKVLQKVIRSKVSKRGVIVETNPSSNYAIGEIDDIFEHYIFNLNKRGLNGSTEIDKSIMATINTDDPSVFNTNISNEIAYIFYALQKKEYSREESLDWIDKIIKYGISSSFIEDRENTGKALLIEMKTEVNNVLKKLIET